MRFRVRSVYVFAGVLALLAARGARAASDPKSFASVGLYSETYRANATQTSNQYPSLFAGGRYERRGESIWAVADGEVFLNTKNTDARYVNVRELYAKLGGVSAGRKLEGWSGLDSFWALGLWEPRFRWNFLEPDVVGLTGFFAGYESESVRLTAFATPLYVPELGAQYEFHDGLVSSPNRFVTVPPRQIPLFGSQLPVRYQLDSTTVSQIVLHPGFGARARVGRLRGPWGQAAYAFQPMNRLALAYEGYLVLASREIDVTLHPRVLYHHLVGLDGGYAGDGWSAAVGALVERPVRDVVSGDWTAERVTPAFLAGPRATFDLSHGGASRLELGYLFSSGGATGDEGPLAAPGRSIFESRYPFRSSATARLAFAASGDAERGLLVSSRSTYDFTVAGALLSLDLDYRPDAHWLVGLGADAVGAGRDAAPDGGADFFDLNRSNDRIRGKVTYVF